MSRSKLPNRRFRVSLLSPLAAALVVAGCGGGGTGPAATDGLLPGASDAPPAGPVVFSGVAATGAALVGAEVRIFAASGDEACSTTTNDAGEYSCTVSPGAAAPFTIEARSSEHRLYSSAAKSSTATVNVTPLTTLIVSRLSASGDPAKIIDEIKADPSLVTQARIDTRVAEVSAMLAPLAAAVGDTLNPISGQFAADGKGHDKVLDSLQINIRPDTGAASIQITFKIKPADDSSAPLQISFLSNQATPPAPGVAIRPQDLVQDGISSLVSGFLARMRACYSLPLAQRISNVPSGAASVSGDATRVQATECRGLFADGDPSAYKDNGLRVGSSGAFPGMYREASTGAAFDAGNFEYRLANGDVFMTFRSTTTAGVIGHSALVLRAQNGQLEAVGNQHTYEAYVRPYATDREFPLQPQYSYFGTGYDIAVPNRIDPVSGSPLFAKAIVTTPAGSTMTLKPVAGRSNMVIELANGTLSGTGVEFFAAAYKEASTVGNPSQKDTTLVFSSVQRTDEELRAIPDQGVWTVEWVHADSALPNVRHSYRTIGRAPTLGEIRQVKFSQFTPALRASWLAREDVLAFQGITFGPPSQTSPTFIDVTAPDGGDGWSVPDGAQFPFSVSAFGRGPDNARFNDTTNVVSTARSARIECSTQSGADLHCDTSTGVRQFAAGGRAWNMELYGRTLRQLELVKSLGLYRLTD